MIQSTCFAFWRSGIIFLLSLVLTSTALAQRGAMTTLRSIDELTQEATLIVHGEVISARVEPHPQLRNLKTVLVTLKVDETLKGQAQKSIQFRQYIWDMRDQLDAAQYAKNQEVLLLLGAVSQYGLRSPVGLEQGRFRIEHDSQGNTFAVNGSGNLHLFADTESRAKARGMKLSPRVTALLRQSSPNRVNLADLEETIRTFSRIQ
jgi:hypothetical protein